ALGALLRRVGSLERAPDALGILCLVDRQEDREVATASRVDEIDAGEVPPGDAQTKDLKRAVCGGHLEAHPFDGDGTVTASVLARDLGLEGATDGVGAGAVASDARPAQESIERRLLDLAVLATVVVAL